MKDLLAPFRGKRTSPPKHPLPQAAQMRAALEQFGTDGTHDADEPSPIFLLANGWRTGSTLLQRILVTDERLLLWGEPLGRMALIPRLTESLCAFAAGWPPAKYWIDEQKGEFSTSWIANLFPLASDLRHGLRQWLLGWLAEPARQRGFTRWGLKEVRLSAADACVLKWLFPQARFLILLRHPFDAYRSASRSPRGLRFWYRWPDYPVDSLEIYAQHWNRLALSWMDLPNDFGHIVIRYEDIVAGSVDFRRLEQDLAMAVDETKAMSTRVGVTKNGTTLTTAERRKIGRIAREGMQAWQYSAHHTTPTRVAAGAK